ncbi:hypothetical protein N9K77_01385 [bacterium]|nr:hypothetical protein [bacterium]
MPIKEACIYWAFHLHATIMTSDLRGIASQNNNIALLYQSNEMNDEALKIFIENKNIALNMDNKGLLEVSLLNIGQTYFNKNQYDSCKERCKNHLIIMHYVHPQNLLLYRYHQQVPLVDNQRYLFCVNT